MLNETVNVFRLSCQQKKSMTEVKFKALNSQKDLLNGNFIFD